ncbi:MAG: hypothetical protein AAF850_11680 [Pseudomonadota bacterium]
MRDIETLLQGLSINLEKTDDVDAQAHKISLAKPDARFAIRMLQGDYALAKHFEDVGFQRWAYVRNLFFILLLAEAEGLLLSREEVMRLIELEHPASFETVNRYVREARDAGCLLIKKVGRNSYYALTPGFREKLCDAFNIGVEAAD